MALDLLIHLYYTILIILVALSVVKYTAGIENNYLYLNFVIIFLIECIVYFSVPVFKKNFTGLYFLLDLLNVIYVYYFFQVHFKQSKVLLFYGIASIGMILLFNKYSFSQYSDFCGIVSCFYVITVCLTGFYLIVQNASHSTKNIQDIPFFWFGLAMLVWSIMYLFRTIPRFYFQDQDKEFMQSLRIFFACINLLTYVVFLKLLSLYKKE
ncbi:hypothetical protein SAMN05421796_101604 [Chryseobacterium piscicola]|uniref:YhhN-like protein n=1 Tax=Chryseobacterium piscicola TaxID=551459 RepID=A0A1N7KJ77_9FLAO|nr:hypothetical protein B0A70_03745 [Chryseobacterium piscicola]SIS61617.1 hypothetical protein SAMN05421796_101604 [Chryseobacterium piscicola]